MMMRMTRPKTKPVTMGRDMNSAAQPSRARPPMSRPMPAPMASADVSATARAGSPWDMSATSEPVSTETVETGPTMRCGDEPRTAYAMRASGMAYRPTMTGHTGDAGVAEGLGNGERRDDESGQDVARDEPPPVPREPSRDRQVLVQR